MRRAGVCGVLLFLGLATGRATPAAQENRPKIGLVLGGGGARGSAHIGVLKVLEENRIPVHVIAGTSMGALVGGTYAAGLSPEELHRRIGGIDWKQVMADDPVRTDLSMREKLNRRKYLPLEFGLRGGKILMSQGAIQGQKLEPILRSMTLHVSKVEEFDQLPIPFRAIATDLETGEEVDLKRGSLADALRASMAVPGVFSPVEVDGRILADGYLVKNVPVDVVQAMGADVLIVVDVGSPLPQREEFDSFLKVSGQAGSIMARKNVREQLEKMKPGDVLIRPDLADITTADFDRCLEGIEAGERAARGMVESLRRFSVSEAEYSEYLKRQRRVQTEPPIVDYVEVEGSARITKETIRSRIRTGPGKPLDEEVLQADITRIHSLGAFEKVGYRIDEQLGRHGIVFKTRDKSWGPDYLRAGLNLATNFRSDSVYNIHVDYRATELNTLGAEWELEGQLGRTNRLATKFYQPLEISRTLFIAPAVEGRHDTVDIYEDGERIAEYRAQRIEGGVDVGASFGALMEIRAGIYRGFVDAEPSTGSAGLPEIEADRGGVRYRVTFDQIDDVYFPKNGFYARSDGWFERKGLGAEESYDKIWNTVRGVATFGLHTFMVGASFGINPGNDAPFYDEFTLGGFLSLSGLRHQELRGRQVASFMIGYYYRLLDLLASLVQEVYVGASFEGGNTWDDSSDMTLRELSLGGSVFIGVRTLLGPVYVGVGKNEEGGRAEIYLYLGQVF